MKKRKFNRTETEHSVEFQIIVREEERVTNLRLSGVITDLCPEGFCITTDYPLSEGYLVTILSPAGKAVPRYGVVRWVHRVEHAYKAGLSHVS